MFIFESAESVWLFPPIFRNSLPVFRLNGITFQVHFLSSALKLPNFLLIGFPGVSGVLPTPNFVFVAIGYESMVPFPELPLLLPEPVHGIRPVPIVACLALPGHQQPLLRFVSVECPLWGILLNSAHLPGLHSCRRIRYRSIQRASCWRQTQGAWLEERQERLQVDSTLRFWKQLYDLGWD